MTRQPYVSTFKAGVFHFTLMTAHTSPSTNIDELEGLEAFNRMVKEAGEPDVIVLGYLNADGDYLRDYDNIAFRSPQYIWVNEEDTTVADKTVMHMTGSFFQTPHLRISPESAASLTISRIMCPITRLSGLNFTQTGIPTEAL